MRRRKSTRGIDSGLKKSPRQRRGPRVELMDAQLHTFRDQLTQALESMWGELGWELETCKKPADIADIFRPLARTSVAGLVDVFVRPSDDKPDAARMRKVRAGRRSLVPRQYQLGIDRSEAQRRFQDAEVAFSRATKREKRLVRQVRKKSRREFGRVEVEYRALSKKDRELDRELKALEASFGRQELFQFVRSKRYELTPLNLANAASNLPYSGWRRSMQRNRRASSLTANGRHYQMFKAIRYLVMKAPSRTVEKLIVHFRDNIPTLSNRFPKEALGEEWYRLERAIRQSCKAKPHPRALPFEIMKRYISQLGSQTQVDAVLAQRARIDVRKRRQR
jgi:hypothetical protein